MYASICAPKNHHWAPYIPNINITKAGWCAGGLVSQALHGGHPTWLCVGLRNHHESYPSYAVQIYNPWRIRMYAIYGNIYHEYTPNASINLPYMDPSWVMYHSWKLGSRVTTRYTWVWQIQQISIKISSPYIHKSSEDPWSFFMEQIWTIVTILVHHFPIGNPRLLHIFPPRFPQVSLLNSQQLRGSRFCWRCPDTGRRTRDKGLQSASHVLSRWWRSCTSPGWVINRGIPRIPTWDFVGEANNFFAKQLN